MPDSPKRGNLVQSALLFVVLFLGIQLLTSTFFPTQPAQPAASGIVLTSPRSFTIGNHPVVQLENTPATVVSNGIGGWLQSKWCSMQRVFTGSPSAHDCRALATVYTGTTVTIENRCPEPPLDVFSVQDAGTPGEKLMPVMTTETTVPCEPLEPLQPGDIVPLSLAPWKYSIFEKPGTYEVRVPGSAPAAASGAVVASTMSARFSVVEPGVFTKAFRTFILAPLLNFLILIASWTPGHNLGIAIILLTIVIKLLLFLPTQHALEGQKKMQLLQPKLEALKLRYKDEPKRIQEETMKLWKEHKINPFQSCLPMLVQFPVLIGLFYVIRDGSNLALSHHLIYGAYQKLPWDFGTSFLGLDLLRPEIFIFPPLLVVLQFFQMKLTFSIQKRKKAKQDSSSRSEGSVIDVTAHGKETEKVPASPQDLQQKMMLYGLPLMIGFFALKFPAAVALYWGVSTLFAIGQQVIVNREHLRV